VVEVFPGGYERPLDALPGSAGRVLGLDLMGRVRPFPSAWALFRIPGLVRPEIGVVRGK
jgi:hypothetical protein